MSDIIEQLMEKRRLVMLKEADEYNKSILERIIYVKGEVVDKEE